MCSETNQNFCHRTLSERQTPLLIDAGLVKGTTLMFGQRLSSLGIQAGVSYAPDGTVVVIPRQGYVFWKGENNAQYQSREMGVLK